MKEATQRTFANRETALHVIQFDTPNLKILQQLWTAHLHALGAMVHDLDLPKEMEIVLSEINDTVRNILLHSA